MRTPTLDEFKTWARDHHALALAVCKTQAFAEYERERVNAYILPIFQRYGFVADRALLKECSDANRPLTTPDELYLSEDPRIPAYYADCENAHRTHGFLGERGHCPALQAENLHIQAENVLLEAAQSLLDADLEGLDLDDRKKMLDLLLGACLKHAPTGSNETASRRPDNPT